MPVPGGERPDSVPPLAPTMLAEKQSWPRVAPQKEETTGSIKSATRSEKPKPAPRDAKLAAALEQKKRRTQNASIFGGLFRAR
jgi:hypothetical protein